MKPTEKIKKLFEKSNLAVSSELNERIMTNATAAFEKNKNIKTADKPEIWRLIMKSRMIKLAAAAVIIIAVLTGLPFIGTDRPAGVALAGVLERIEQAQAYMYKMQMTMIGSVMHGQEAKQTEGEGTILMSNDYGAKMDITTTTITDANSEPKTTTQQMYMLHSQKALVMVMPEQKKYMRMEFDDDLLARMKKQNNDPREMIKQIMSCKYTELGRSVIDGVEVQGFQTTDPAVYGGTIEDVNVILWVDVEKWLPVRTEMEYKMGEGMQMSGFVYDYQWNIPVEAGDFEPVIPEDFTTVTSEPLKMPSGSEEGAIEGLKFFAEILGHYPRKLNLMNLMQEFAAIKNSKNLTEAGLKFKEEMEQIGKEKGEMTEEQRVKIGMHMMRPVQSLGMFYMLLAQEKKEPAYYGEYVSPGDADSVLLRWKVSDDEYRVIYGDLSAESVSAQRLAELEAGLAP